MSEANFTEEQQTRVQELIDSAYVRAYKRATGDKKEEDSEMFDKLKAPFPPSRIQWRAERSGQDKNGKSWVLVLAYLDNRAVMERLDEVAKPENWRNEYHELPSGGVICGISLRIDGEWVTKWDGADKTNIEAVKGGLSGAMKRAAVQWGIGRYLYDLDSTFATINTKGSHSTEIKDKKTKKTICWVKWDDPILPSWALPGGAEPKSRCLVDKDDKVPGETLTGASSGATSEMTVTNPTYEIIKERLEQIDEVIALRKEWKEQNPKQALAEGDITKEEYDKLAHLCELKTLEVE